MSDEKLVKVRAKFYPGKYGYWNGSIVNDGDILYVKRSLISDKWMIEEKEEQNTLTPTSKAKKKERDILRTDDQEEAAI